MQFLACKGMESSKGIGAAIVENPFANNAQRQFRQVMVSVSGDQRQTPIRLRVAVGFSPCVAGTAK
jgi:hypothetical protein